MQVNTDLLKRELTENKEENRILKVEMQVNSDLLRAKERFAQRSIFGSEVLGPRIEAITCKIVLNKEDKLAVNAECAVSKAKEILKEAEKVSIDCVAGQLELYSDGVSDDFDDENPRDYMKRWKSMAKAKEIRKRQEAYTKKIQDQMDELVKVLGEIQKAHPEGFVGSHPKKQRLLDELRAHRAEAASNPDAEKKVERTLEELEVVDYVVLDKDNPHFKLQNLIEIYLERCRYEQAMMARIDTLADLMPEAEALDTSIIQSLSDAFVVPEDGVTPEVVKNWSGSKSPLHLAAELDRGDIVHYILQQKSCIDLLSHRDAHGCIPLYYASTRGFGVLDLRLRELSLGSAARPGDVKPFMKDGIKKPAINLLPELQKYLQTIEQDGWNAYCWKDGFTFLHWAAKNGHTELFEYLLRLGADLDCVDDQNCTAHHVASRHVQWGILESIRKIREVGWPLWRDGPVDTSRRSSGVA